MSNLISALEAIRSLSEPQREAYELLIELKVIMATRQKIKTYESLVKVDLAKRSEKKNEYELNGPALRLPPKITIKSLMPKPPKWKRPPADHTNISREQHVERWINTKI